MWFNDLVEPFLFQERLHLSRQEQSGKYILFISQNDYYLLEIAEFSILGSAVRVGFPVPSLCPWVNACGNLYTGVLSEDVELASLLGSVYSPSSPHPSKLAMPDNKTQHCRGVLQRGLDDYGICVVIGLPLNPPSLLSSLHLLIFPAILTCMSYFCRARCPLSPYW